MLRRINLGSCCLTLFCPVLLMLSSVAAENTPKPNVPAPDTTSIEAIPGEAPITALGESPERPEPQAPDTTIATPQPKVEPLELPPGLEQSLSRVQEIMERPTVGWPEKARSDVTTLEFNQQGQVTDAMKRSEDANMRQRALESMEPIDPAQLLPAWNALRDPNPENRIAAVEYLRQVPGDALAKLILEHLNGPDGAQWATVLEEPLSELRSALEPPMLSLLKGSDGSLMEQRIAIWSLGRMGSLTALPLLSEGAWSLEPTIVEECVYALEALRSTTTVPVWAQLTQHKQYDVRQYAVKNLNALGGPESFDTLAELALGRTAIEPVLQQEVVRGLTQWPPEETVPLLLLIMRNNPNVRGLIGDYFRQLTGVDLPDMPAQWEVYFFGSSKSVPEYRPTPQPGNTGNDLLDNTPLVPPGFIPG